jgi:hypothetical protein
MLGAALAGAAARRALYEVSDNYAGMLTEQNRLLEILSELLLYGPVQKASHREARVIVSRKWPNSTW